MSDRICGRPPDRLARAPQGANKGLGLAIVKTLLANQPDATVLATVRAVAAAEGLFALREPLGGRLEVVEMDVEDEASVKVRRRPLFAPTLPFVLPRRKT